MCNYLFIIYKIYVTVYLFIICIYNTRVYCVEPTCLKITLVYFFAIKLKRETKTPHESSSRTISRLFCRTRFCPACGALVLLWVHQNLLLRDRQWFWSSQNCLKIRTEGTSWRSQVLSSEGPNRTPQTGSGSETVSIFWRNSSDPCLRALAPSWGGILQEFCSRCETRTTQNREGVCWVLKLFRDPEGNWRRCLEISLMFKEVSGSEMFSAEGGGLWFLLEMRLQDVSRARVRFWAGSVEGSKQDQTGFKSDFSVKSAAVRETLFKSGEK